MSASKIPLHGRNHLPGGSDPIPFSGIYPGNPVRIQLDIPFPSDDSAHWGTFTIDNAVRGNGYLESDGNTGAYLERKFALGPKGSVWRLMVGYAEAPDAGILKASIASVPSPNPVREGELDFGTLAPDGSGGADPWTFVSLGTVDTYAASLTDAADNVGSVFRLMGADNAELTALAALGDSFIPCSTADGGAGQYALRLEVDGKNASSSSYVLRVTEAVFLRLDDSVFA